jgi:hypothetical protein
LLLLAVMGPAVGRRQAVWRREPPGCSGRAGQLLLGCAVRCVVPLGEVLARRTTPRNAPNGASSSTAETNGWKMKLASPPVSATSSSTLCQQAEACAGL